MGKGKNSRKNKGKVFYGNSKNNSGENNFTPTNSTPVPSKISSVQLSNTTKANIVLVLYKRLMVIKVP